MGRSQGGGHVGKHGLSFTTALAVFLDPYRAEVDTTREEDGERRLKMIGRLEAGLVTVIFTMRGDMTRVISARRANTGEECRYGDG